MDAKATLEVHCQALEKSEMKLRNENSQLKEVAEVARQQGVAVEMWRKSHDLEVGALRQQLLDYETQSDDSTRLAALHRQVLVLQVGEASASKKLECANSRILALEASLLKSEQQRDGCVESVSKVKAKCHSKVKQLRVVVQVIICLLVQVIICLLVQVIICLLVQVIICLLVQVIICLLVQVIICLLVQVIICLLVQVIICLLVQVIICLLVQVIICLLVQVIICFCAGNHLFACAGNHLFACVSTSTKVFPSSSCAY